MISIQVLRILQEERLSPKGSVSNFLGKDIAIAD